MKLLFGPSESPLACTSASGSDYSYCAWKGEDDVWYEELHVFGKPIFDVGVGSRNVARTIKLVTLKDRDVHIWNYLEIKPRQNFASAMRQVVIALTLLVTFFVLSQVLAFLFGEFGYMSLRWYFRYPLFGIASFFVVFAVVFAYENLTYEYKLRKASRFIRELSSQGNSDVEFYKNILEKIAVCNDKERSRTARKLLDRGLV